MSNTYPSNTEKKPITIYKKKEDPKITSFFSAAPALAPDAASIPAPAEKASSPSATTTTTDDSKEEEKDKPPPSMMEQVMLNKKKKKSKEPFCIEIPHQPIPLMTDKNHISWMKQTVASEKYTGSWVVVEQPMGKDLMVYTDGEFIRMSTPYHGFIDNSMSPFSTIDTFRSHLWALYTKLKTIFTDIDQIVLHLVLYGSGIDPGSKYSNTTARLTLVDVYLRYPSKEPDPETNEHTYEYKTLQYSHLIRYIEHKGVFKDKNGKPIENLMFTVPSILKMHRELQTALDAAAELVSEGKVPVSEFDKNTKLEGVIVKPDEDLWFTPKKKPNERKQVLTKARVAVEEYPNFTTFDCESRQKGGPFISKTIKEMEAEMLQAKKQQQEEEEQEKEKKEEKPIA